MTVIAISGAFEFTDSDNMDVVVLHQSSDPAFTNDEALILEFFGHSLAVIGTAIADVHGANVGQKHHVIPLALAGRTRHLTCPRKSDPG